LPEKEVETIAASIARYEPDQIATARAEGRGNVVEILEYREFPLEALPDPVRGFVDAGARAIGCDPSYLALPLLTALASAVGGARALELKGGWRVPAILWAAIVGESGTAKSPAIRAVTKPVYERQRRALERHAEAMRRYKEELVRFERNAAAWKKSGDGLPPVEPEEPQAERYIVSDVTPEAIVSLLANNPRGLLLARDELSGWLAGFDKYTNRNRVSSELPAWLSMYDGASIVVDRKTGPRTLHVPRANVCILGGVQPAILRRALGPEFREAGLAARLLLAHPPRKARQWTEASIDPAVEAELEQLFDRLYELQPMTGDDGAPQPVIVRLDDGAKKLWVEFFNAHSAEQVNLSGDLAAAWSKLAEVAPRLALVLHYARWASGDVADELRLDGASMSMAIELTQWFKYEAKRAYGLLDESDAEREQRRLIEWIANRGGRVTAREVQTYYWKLKSPGQAEAELEKLAQAGYGGWQSVPAAPKGGRPARVFVLTHAPTKQSQGKPSAKPLETQEILSSADAEAVEERTTKPRPSAMPSPELGRLVESASLAPAGLGAGETPETGTEGEV
jgi:hypothetical protein